MMARNLVLPPLEKTSGDSIRELTQLGGDRTPRWKTIEVGHYNACGSARPGPPLFLVFRGRHRWCRPTGRQGGKDSARTGRIWSTAISFLELGVSDSRAVLITGESRRGSRQNDSVSSERPRL